MPPELSLGDGSQAQQPAVGTVAPLEKGWVTAAGRGVQPRDRRPEHHLQTQSWHTLPAHEHAHDKNTLCADMSQERRKYSSRAYKYRPWSDTTSANLICPSRLLGKQRCAAKELGNPNRCVTNEQNDKVLHKSNHILPNSLQNQKMDAFFPSKKDQPLLQGLAVCSTAQSRERWCRWVRQGQKRECHSGKTALAEHAGMNKKAFGNFSHHRILHRTAKGKIKSCGFTTTLPGSPASFQEENKTKQIKIPQPSNQTKKEIKLLIPVYQGQGESH